MKKLVSIIITIAIMLSISSVCFAIAPPYIRGLELSRTSDITLVIGESISFDAIADECGFGCARFLWTIEGDEGIISLEGSEESEVVNEGVLETVVSDSTVSSSIRVRGLTKGSAVVKVYANVSYVPNPETDVSAQITIKVVEGPTICVFPKVVDISVSGEEIITMNVGEEITLEGMAEFDFETDRCALFWVPKNKDLISATDNGKTFQGKKVTSTATIKGLSPGVTNLELQINDGVAFVTIIVLPQMYYSNGTFSIDSDLNKVPVLAVYKNKAFVDVALANEIDLSKLDYDEISVMYLEDSAGINPFIPKTTLTKDQVLLLVEPLN